MSVKSSVNRGWLRRQAAAGRLWIKCCFHMTDDYAFDNANNCGKMDSFKQAYLYQPIEDEEYSKLKEELEALYASTHPYMPDSDMVLSLRNRMEWIYRAHHQQQQDLASGKIMVDSQDFRYKSGHVYGDKERGSWSIHSNLNYEYEIRNEKT